MLSFLRKYSLPIVWALLTLTACGINGNSIPKISFNIGIDKIAHFILFGMQSWLIIRAQQKGNETINWRQVNYAVLFGISYGIVIEILQATIFINRSYDYADMLANSIGAVSCYGFTYLRWGLK
ncbi:MAG: hypothetical protein CFE21_03185 [Bacteroidetes bacterium B1(2017)]|nr:MAG: hypothetical protein CFE21_03185 [Bacteroidetes bacterium B1(2017)]